MAWTSARDHKTPDFFASSRTEQSWRLVAVSLLLLGVIGTARAEEPGELYRFVGADAGACLEISKLDSAWPRVRDSHWLARLQKLSVYAEWSASEDFRRLQEARIAIEKRIGRPLEQLALDLFGRSTLLAIYPQEGGAGGVLITRSRNADVLQQIIELWNQSEPHEMVAKEHAGKPYFLRTPKTGNPLFYAALGDVLFLSDREPLLQKTLALSAAGAAGRSLRDNSLFQQAFADFRDDQTLRLFVNPRMLDGALGIGQAEGNAGQRLTFGIWKACRAVTAGLDLRDGPVVEVTAHYDPSSSVPGWTSFLNETRGPAGMLQRAPGDALFVFAGRARWNWIDAAIRHWSQPEQLKGWHRGLQVLRGLCLGLDPVNDILPQIGPDWGWFVVPGRDDSTAGPAVDAVFSWELTPLKAGSNNQPAEQPDLRAALDNALQTGLNLWVAAHNSREGEATAVIRVRGSADARIRWIERIGPYQPAYVLTPGYLLLGTSPALLEAFQKQDPATSVNGQRDFRHWSSRYFPEENQVAYVNVAQVRKLFQTHRPQILRQSGSPTDKVEKRLERLEEWLQVLDGAFVAGRVESDKVRVVLGLVAAPVP